MTGILEQLKWESLKKGSKDCRLTMLYTGLKRASSIHTLSNDRISPNRRARNHHSPAFQTPLAGTDICKAFFLRLEYSE